MVDTLHGFKDDVKQQFVSALETFSFNETSDKKKFKIKTETLFPLG